MNQTGSAIPRRVDGSELFTTSAPGVTTARLADESGAAYSDGNPLPECNAQIGSLY